MRGLATTRQSFWRLIGDSFANYWPVLQSIIFMAILFVMMRELGNVVTLLKLKPLLSTILLVIISFLNIYFSAVVLFYTYHFLDGSRVPWGKCFRSMGGRFSKIFSAIIVILLVLFVCVFIGFLLSGLLHRFYSAGWAYTLSLAVLVAFPVIYLIIKFFMAIPLIAIEDGKVFQSLSTSGNIVSGRNWFRTLGVLLFQSICGSILIFFSFLSLGRKGLSVGMQHVDAGAGFHWNASYLIYLILSILFYPLLINLTVSLYRDLRLRHPKQG